MPCTTSGYFGSPRESVSRCKTYSRSAVTAEAAGSSPVVPAILSKGVIGRDTENSNPQSSPHFPDLPIPAEIYIVLTLSGINATLK
jgi:hypothetical protein